MSPARIPGGAPDGTEAMSVVVPAAGEARLVHGSPAQNANLFKQNVDRMMEGDDMCIVCMEQPPAVLLMPCAHICACEACAPKLSKCPVCSCLVERRQAATMKAVVKNKIRSAGHTLADGPLEEGAVISPSLQDGADGPRSDSEHKTPVENDSGIGRESSIGKMFVRSLSGKSLKIAPVEQGTSSEVHSLKPQQHSPDSVHTIEATQQGSTNITSYLGALWRYFFNPACIRPRCVSRPSEQEASEEQERHVPDDHVRLTSKLVPGSNGHVA